MRATRFAGLLLALGCVAPYHGLTPPGRAVGGLAPSHREPDLLASADLRHTVAPGENLYRIALKYGVPLSELQRANGISDVRTLKVGQQLQIPVPSTAQAAAPADDGRVRSTDIATATAPMVVSSGPVRRDEDEERQGRPTLGPGRPESFGHGELAWPLRGVLYGRYGKRGREMHDGVDLAAPLGTPVKTAAGGTVLFAGEQRGYGLIVVVDHANGLVTLYAHNRDLRVKAGQKVRPGQVIATVGESGKTSGPHLHFEVREHGKPVDPLPRLGPAPRG